MTPKTEQKNLLMLASLATRYEENSVKPKMMSFRTFRKKEFTCELCGFEPKTKNKYREKQDHLMNRHFKKQIDELVNNTYRNLKCPNCDYKAGDRQSLLRHYTAKHGILEKLLSQALEERNIDDEMKVVENRGTKRKLVKVSEEEKNSTPKKLALSATLSINNNVMIPKVVSTNSTPQPTNILPKNTTVSLVPQIINADIPILLKVPTFTIEPLVPKTTTEATSAPKLKFQCQQCFKPFQNNRDLTRHAVVHTQEKNFRCSFCNAAFFGRKDHLVRHEQNCNNKKMIVESKLSPGSAVQSFIRVRPLNQLMPSPITSVATEEEPIAEEFNHPISDDPYIPTILDPTYYPVDYPVEDPEVVQLVISEKTGENHIEENSIDQQETVETELEHIATNEWSGITRVHSLIPTIIDDVVHDDDEAEKEMDVAIDENYDDQEPTNLVIDENVDEDLELVIDEDFSSDVMVEDDQNDIINDDVNKRDICLHIPLKKRGKFSCINCSLQRVS